MVEQLKIVLNSIEEEIKRKIMDNDLYNHLFMSKYLNY